MSSNVRLERQSKDVVFVAWRGHISTSDVEHAQRLLLAEHAEPARFLIGDISEVTGFDPASRIAAVELLRTLRDTPFEKIVTISTSTFLRMFISTIALAAGFPVLLAADRIAAAEALTPRPNGRERRR